MGEFVQLTAADGFVLSAYEAKPAGKARGGLVVVQEIFGVNAHIRRVADGYAARGYHVLSPGIFDRAEKNVDLGYDKADVAGLLEDRLGNAKERLGDALEQVRALCEPVEVPKDQAAYLRYFSSKESGNAAQLKANEPQRLSLYKLTAALVRNDDGPASHLSTTGGRRYA